MDRSGEWRGVAAAAASSLLGGASVVATRFAIGATDPLMLALLRYGIGVLCLLPLVVAQRRAAVAAEDRWPIIGLGVLFFAVFPVLFNASLALTTAARGSLALSTLPLLTMTLAALWRAEALTGGKIAGVLLALGGVALALSSGLEVADGAWRGDLLMIVTAGCGAVYNVLAGPYLRRYPALAVTAWAMLAGTIALAPATLGAGSLAAPPIFTPAQWGAVAFLGIIGGALTFLLWSWGLEHTTPTRVAITVTLNPVAALALGIPVLDEAVTGELVLGLLAVIGGIVLATRPPGPAWRELADLHPDVLRDVGLDVYARAEPKPFWWLWEPPDIHSR